MKKPNAIMITALVSLLVLSSLSWGQTTFTNSGEYIDVASNWDNGLPDGAGNPGTINVTAKLSSRTLTNLYVTLESGGSIVQGVFGENTLSLMGGQWTINGGSVNTRGQTLDSNALLTFNDGTSVTVNNSHLTIFSGSQYILNGGTITLDRNLYLRGGNFTISGGTCNQDKTDAFGAPGFSAEGSMNFNGGTVDAGRFTFQGVTTATFGGTTAGSATFNDWGRQDSSDRHDDDVISIDFLSGTLVSLSVTNARDLVFGTTTNTNPWAEALWENDKLTFDGSTSTDLAKAWNVVTNSNGLGNYYRFDYDTDTETLSLAHEPPPAGTLLIIL